MIRVGHGYDVHPFGPGDHVVIGGVRIPHSHGVKAHSDGDVVIHALCDALLGAAALGDIGRQFPDSDPQYAKIDSRVFLRRVKTLLDECGYKPGNVDLTVVAQIPKVSPYIKTMRELLAEDLRIHQSKVNIKATTTEGLGFIGRGEGIAAYAVASIVEVNAKTAS